MDLYEYTHFFLSALASLSLPMARTKTPMARTQRIKNEVERSTRKKRQENDEKIDAEREMVSSSSTTTATMSLKTTTAMTVKSLNCRLIDYISISTGMFVSITENMLAFAYAEQRWLGDFVLLLHFSSCVFCTGSGSGARARTAFTVSTLWCDDDSTTLVTLWRVQSVTCRRWIARNWSQYIIGMSCHRQRYAPHHTTLRHMISKWDFNWTPMRHSRRIHIIGTR